MISDDEAFRLCDPDRQLLSVEAMIACVLLDRESSKNTIATAWEVKCLNKLTQAFLDCLLFCPDASLEDLIGYATLVSGESMAVAYIAKLVNGVPSCAHAYYYSLVHLESDGHE